MPKDISIIIVNYNVQYFIEQCLNSIFTVSDFEGDVEVIVVDNNSSDDSIRVIKDSFPQVHLIENKKNVGFSIANNQGIAQANCKYILLLNPDTILSENTLSTCYKTMEDREGVGALGVRMVDGAGKFLPESKRGFPTPAASFFRFSGLFKLFPKSATINRYYQGHIGEFETAEIEILCGAFMFIRKTVLDKIGYLDENFFMYGEDIDLSYRIKSDGSSILYSPDSSIVHFKGESTKKDSVQYTKRFYNAMDIFARKHFKDSKASLFLRYLSVAIWLKATLNRVQSLFKKLILPLLDIVALFGGLILISKMWAKLYFNDLNYYTESPLTFNFTIYTIIWFISILFGGGYDKRVNVLKLIRNLLLGTLVILAVYGLLDAAYRSSRAVILIATVYALIVIPIFRIVLGQFLSLNLLSFRNGKKVVVLAGEKEFQKIEEVLSSSNRSFQSLERLPTKVSLYELKEIVEIRKINEIICNVRDVGMTRIIELMSALGGKVSFKITGDESLGIIGSQSKNKSGEIYTVEISYNIQSQNSRRLKRTFDMIAILFCLILAPVMVFSKQVRLLLKDFGMVFIGQKTIIGYEAQPQLPVLKPAVFHLQQRDATQYAKEYSIWKEMRYLWKILSQNYD